jgi:hypothetical protein
MKQASILLAGAVFMFVSNGFAGEFKLTEGKDKKICKAYKASVESLDSMAWCKSRINPEFKEFKEPEWLPKDLLNSKVLVDQAEGYLGTGNLTKGIFAERPKDLDDMVRQMVELGLSKLWEMKIDLDNDGTPDRVLRYEKGKCSYTGYNGSALIILDAQSESIDVPKTKSLEAVGAKDWHNVFVYQNEVYFDNWFDDMNEFSVHEMKNNKLKTICTLRYK